MAEVHEALKSLAPAPHSNFPRSRSSLDVHITNNLLDVHTLISSIPPPDNLPPDLHLPAPPNADSKALQKEWKPVKMSPKENPLGISVFKMSAKDGRGAWFARRSVHADIPFARFKAGLQREFDQPKRSDGDGTGAVRGIGKDSTVQEHQSDLGKAEVMVLSAQFPGPSAPRMFIEGYLTTSAHPEDLSASAGQDAGAPTPDAADAQFRPKQFTVISKPVLDHPDVEDRPGYVLGQYESIEFIREIPLEAKHIDRAQSYPNVLQAAEPASPTRRRGKTVSGHPDDPNPPPNPVEWIMITRSDPGGSVPRWMVERGTPGGIVKDAEKFVNWCRDAHHLDEMHEASLEQTINETAKGQVAHQDPEICSQTQKHLAGRGGSTTSSASTIVARDHAQGQLSPSPEAARTLSIHSASAEPPAENKKANSGGGGLFSSLAAGVTSLASSAIPSSIGAASSTASNVHTPPPSEPDIPTPATTLTDTDTATDPLSSDDDDDAASIGSFATAVSKEDALDRTISGTPTAGSGASQSETPESQALQQFLKEKAKLEEKLRREEAKRMEKERKTTEKHLRNLEKRERKFRRAVEKAEERKRREAEKARKAKDARDAKDGAAQQQQQQQPVHVNGHHHHHHGNAKKEGWREVESLKRVVEELTRENLELKERVEQLENEKMLLEGRAGILDDATMTTTA